MRFAQRNGQILRGEVDPRIAISISKANTNDLIGHNCVWHQQLPDWVLDGTFTESEILAAVERHCGTLVGHYRGQM